MSAQYFAQIDNNNVVLTVHVVTAEFMAQNPDRYQGVWVETFFDDPNKKYAGIGDTWNGTVFIASQPFPSWSLDENDDWQPPTQMPTDGGMYRWNETDLDWVEV